MIHHGAVEGQHHPPGLYFPLRGQDAGRLPRLQAQHGAIFIHLHPQLPGDPQQPAHQQGGLHRAPVGAEHPLQVRRRATLPGQILLRYRPPLVQPGLLQLAHDGRHAAALGLAGGGVAAALHPQLGLDAVRRAEIGYLLHRLFRGTHQPGGLPLAKALAQAGVLGRPGEQAAAVATRGAAAAQPLLQHQDAQTGLRLFEVDGAPEPGEAAADDADVGLQLAPQRGGLGRGFGGEGLGQPEGVGLAHGISLVVAHGWRQRWVRSSRVRLR
ncbi:hypothetical protein D3C78_1150670 [compost metagenome]